MKDVQVPFPYVSKELIDKLEELFPKKDFDTTTSLREMDFHNGQRSLVNVLKLNYTEQHNNILKGD